MDPYWTDESASLTQSNHFTRLAEVQTNPLERSYPEQPAESINRFATPERDIQRVITAIDQRYNVEDLGLAGDARVLNLRDQLTGAYIMTVTVTTTP